MAKANQKYIPQIEDLVDSGESGYAIAQRFRSVMSERNVYYIVGRIKRKGVAA